MNTSTSANPVGESLTLQAPDGFELSATVYRTTTPRRGMVLVVPAMGVGQGYYQRFAGWLAEQGFDAVTFDYRGTGESRRGSLRGFEATILDWAELDAGAVVEWMVGQAQNTPMYWIGHSLGGQIVPFVPQHERFRKLITVATGSGYWRENAPALRRRVWWLWFFVVPVAMALWGYFPGRKLRKVGDLPKGVMTQWRRWCLNPEYSVGVEDAARQRYASVTLPIFSLSFTDDEMMSERNIASIHSFYTGSQREMRRLSPQDVEAQRVGHFGFFRKQFRSSLWEQHLLPQLC